MPPSQLGALRRALPLAPLVLAGMLILPSSVHADEAQIGFDGVMAERVANWRDAGMSAPLLAQIEAGADIWWDHCAACHGDLGEGGNGFANPIINTRGLDKLRTGHRLFIYTRGLMPFQDPGSLEGDEYWQVTAWLMAMNGWLDGLDAPLGPENARGVAIGP